LKASAAPGPPGERDKAAVARDLALGLVTRGAPQPDTRKAVASEFAK